MGPMSDSGKIASASAHQRPPLPSIDAGPAERFNAGASGVRKPGYVGIDGREAKPAADIMGMSVAIQGDARQAAAVKLAEEQAVVRNAQAGDRLAFEELVHRYDREVLRLALNLVHKPEDARDIYQESFLRVYRNLHRFRFECSFYTWLYRIVTNLCLDQLRRRKSRREDPATALDASGDEMDLMANVSDDRAMANPARELERKVMGEQINAALDKLTPRERTVFELKHFQGLKLRTIGDMLSTTEETAKNTLFRATRKLREQLRTARSS